MDALIGKSPINCRLPLVLGVGPSGMVVVGTRKGDLTALDQRNGRIIFMKNVGGEMLAKPSVADDSIVIKTIDGSVQALDFQGTTLWSYQQSEPNLFK